MMTDSEARDRWCPFARVGVHEHADGRVEFFVVNRAPTGEQMAQAFCLGSECMAWRWATKSSMTSPYPGGKPVPATKRETGFCGLAGRP